MIDKKQLDRTMRRLWNEGEINADQYDLYLRKKAEWSKEIKENAKFT